MTTNDGLYKLVIVGGGPAGIGVFIRAARTGYLPRLLDPQSFGTPKDRQLSEKCEMKQKGVAILHDGDESSFGSGNLGSYIINSNSFARSLLSSVLDEKPDLDPPESIKNTFLANAREHESTKRLEEIGAAPAGLVDFGRFLHYIGCGVRKELANHDDTSKCMLNTRATKFDVLENGVICVEAQGSNGETIRLHTEHLLLAMGGKQEVPTENPVLRSKSFTSDTCLREEGFAKLKQHLLKSNDPKVCVVGGSHSSFSVAWLLLNKIKNSSVKRKSSNQIETISPVAAADISLDQQPSVSASSSSPTKCDSIKNAGAVAYDSLVFKPKDITILHRSPIRCYYVSRKDAEADGTDGSRVDRSGCVNTFTGLRTDSKRLYKDIKAGKELRVRLFQINQHGCQNLTMKAYESASAIVWCCGYKTRMIPGFDVHGKALRYQEENGVIKLDLTAHLQTELAKPTTTGAASSTSKLNVMGVGLGFSLRASVDEMGTETRADGVTVYHRRGASLVLAALFGPEVFGSSALTFEEMVEKNDQKKKKKDGKPETVGASIDQIRRPSKPIRLATEGSGSIVTPSPAKTLATPAKITLTMTPAKSALTASPTAASSALKRSILVKKSDGPTTATNPPVKLLLGRRRSGDTLMITKQLQSQEMSNPVMVSPSKPNSTKCNSSDPAIETDE